MARKDIIKLFQALKGSKKNILKLKSSFNVIFAPDEPILAQQVVALSDPGADWWYIATVKLIEV